MNTSKESCSMENSHVMEGKVGVYRMFKTAMCPKRISENIPTE